MSDEVFGNERAGSSWHVIEILLQQGAHGESAELYTHMPFVHQSFSLFNVFNEGEEHHPAGSSISEHSLGGSARLVIEFRFHMLAIDRLV